MGGVSISQQRNSVSKEVGIHELNIHRSLSHPNIVRFIDSYQKDQSIYLEMEFCQGKFERQLRIHRVSMIRIRWMLARSFEFKVEL